MTTGFHVSGCAYPGAPQVPWKQSNQSRPLEVSVAAELFSQNGIAKESSGGLLPQRPQNLGARNIFFNVVMKAKENVIPKIGSSETNNGASKYKVKIPEKEILGIGRGLDSHPV